MRLIDADAFENYVFDEWQKNEISNGDWIQFREWLKDQESVVELHKPITKVFVRGVEYVPIIRCKDCKWYDGYYCHNPWWGDGYGNYTPPIKQEEGFCDWAERKEE